MWDRSGRGTVSGATTQSPIEGTPVGTLLKPDPDKPRPADAPAVSPAPEAEPESIPFVERPRKVPDIYISRPDLGPKR